MSAQSFSDQLTFLVRFLRKSVLERDRQRGDARLWFRVTSLFWSEMQREVGHNPNDMDPELRSQWWGGLWDAAWHLVRLGYLRPGPYQAPTRRQMYADDLRVEPDMFALTPLGAERVRDSEQVDAIMEVTSFDARARRYAGRFGEGFLQRATEASRCIEAGAWLATCAMAGAAAEAVLECAAAHRTGDKQRVEKLMDGAQGRNKVLKLLIDGQPSRIEQPLRHAFNQLFRWRDESAHGGLCEYSGDDAHASLYALLRVADTIERSWEELRAGE